MLYEPLEVFSMCFAIMCGLLIPIVVAAVIIIIVMNRYDRL